MMQLQQFSVKKFNDACSDRLKLEGMQRKSFMNSVKSFLHNRFDSWTERMTESFDDFVYRRSSQAKFINALLYQLTLDGYIHIKNDTIKTKYEVSIATKNAAMKVIEGLGIVKRFQVHSGHQAANVYVLMIHPNAELILSYLATQRSSKSAIAEFRLDHHYQQDWQQFCQQDKTEEPLRVKDEDDLINSTSLTSNTFKKESLKDIYSDVSSQSEYDSKLVDLEKDAIENCTALGVPTWLALPLTRGLSVLQIRKVWIGFKRTMDKHKINIDEYQPQILSAARNALIKLKIHQQKGKDDKNPVKSFNFTGCFSGFSRDRIFASQMHNNSAKQTLNNPVRPLINHKKVAQRPVIEIIGREVGKKIVSDDELSEVLRMAEELNRK